MNSGSYGLWLRINGNGHAFLREPGCRCGRCRPKKPFDDDCISEMSGGLAEFPGLENPRYRAATSASLLLVDDDRVVKHHILVDVGPGVCNSLVDVRLPAPDCLLVTHWHPDHLLDINRLVECRRRDYKGLHGDPPKGDCPRLPVYCTPETWRVVERRHDYEAKHRLKHRTVSPGLLFHPEGPGPNPPHLPAIVPISVEHGPAKGCVIYCVQWQGKRLLLAWDMLRAPLSWEAPEISILVMEANTWTPQPTGHISLMEGLQVLKRWRPERTLFAHISGHEDPDEQSGWGWPDPKWERRIRAQVGGKADVGVARQGQLIHVA